MQYLKKQVLYERKVGDRQLVVENDGTIEFNPGSGTVKIAGDLEVTGQSSGFTDPKVYYVSLQGNDDNDGLAGGASRAKRTIKSAVEAAPEGATIKVSAGDFYEENPITLKERQTVRGDSLRNTQIYPKNNTQTIFYVDNACYLFQLTFRALRDPGWCVEIKPNALVTVSPYVQNCTNMNGPWLNDGTEFIPFKTEQIAGVPAGARPIENDPNVPLAKRVNTTGGGNGMLVDGNQYDQKSLVFSMVADAFTQIAQGGIGFHITNFGYTQIVSCFSVFTRIGFQATKGGYLSISNSVSDFGTFAIIADGVFDEVYTTARPAQDYRSKVGSITVNSGGAGYQQAPTVSIAEPEDPTGTRATATATIDATTGELTGITVQNQGDGYKSVPTITLTGGGFSVPAEATANLLKNQQVTVNSLRDVPQTGSLISFEGDSQKYYVTSTDITTRPFIYDEAVCRRDVRRIVDAVMGDIVMGTNYQSLAAGRSYLRANSAKVLNQQQAPTIYGIEAARDEVLERLPDYESNNVDIRYDIIERFAEITQFIENEDSTAAPDIFYNDDTAVTDGHHHAKDTLLLNKDFIIEEVIEYVSDQFTNLSYNQDKCERDVRLVVQAIADDVMLGTDYRTIYAGLAYLRKNSIRVINDQLTVTKEAYKNVREKMLALPQVVASPVATSRVENLFTEFFDILNGSDYSKTKCRRDLGLIFDAVQYDSLLGTNYNSVTAGLSYERAPAYYVIGSQFQQTVRAIERARDLAVAEADADATAEQRVEDNFQEIIDIITIADSSQDDSTINRITWSDPGALYQNKTNAREQLQTNRAFIISELTAWIGTNYPALNYDSDKCERDTGFIIDAVSHDVQYGGNFATRGAANAYFEGTAAQLPADQRAATAAAYEQLSVICQSIILETYAGQDVTGNAASATEQTEIDDLITIIEDVITANSVSGMPALVEPTTSWVDSDLSDAIDDVLAEEANIIDEVIAEILVTITNADTVTFPNPTTVIQQKVDSKDQLLANKDFMVEDTIRFIENTYPNLDYDVDRCRRDTGYIIDALVYDLLYDSNEATRQAALSYFVGTTGQLGSDDEETATAAAYQHLQGLTTGVILESAITRQTGNTLTQDISGTPGTATQTSRVSDLIDIIIDVIEEDDTDNLPGVDRPTFSWVQSDIQAAGVAIRAKDDAYATESTAFILDRFPDFTYDREKCKRDVGLILDAVTRDSRLDTNHNSLVAGLAYQRASAATYKAQQMPATLMAIREAKRLALTYVQNSSTAITRVTENFDHVLEAIEYGTLPSEGYSYPAPGPATQARIDSVRLIQANKDFLIEDTIQYVNNQYYIYDSAKCRRDTELILKAVTDDLQMGTNYNSVTAGLSYYNANAQKVIDDQLTETIGAITHAKTQSLTYITDDSASTTTVGNLFDEVLDIIQNGTGNADALTFTNPLSNAQATNARTLMQLNRTFVINELISWINTNYPNLEYDRDKCERDTGYIIDALSYDIQYETNQATIQAAKLYYEGTASQLPYSQRFATAAAYEQLGDILGGIVMEEYPGQTNNGGSIADSDIVEEIAGLASEVSESITANTIALLPDSIDLDLSGTSAAAIDSAEDIYVTNKTAILDSVINYIRTTYNGFSYDETKCRRDTGYLIESTSHDLLYGGNRSSKISALSYFDDGDNQVYGQESQTSAALVHLKSIIDDIIEGAAIVAQTGNDETQVINGTFGTSADSTIAQELLDITIDAIDAGDTDDLPDDDDPDFAWIDANLESALSTLDDAKSTIQTGVITFITENIIAFDYNEDKCRRDTSYIFDAAIYDMMYGGNKQTRRAGEAYYNNSVIDGQEAITEFTYKHLATMMSKLAQNQAFTKTSTNSITRVYGTNAGTADAGASLSTNLNKIAEVIQLGGTTYLPDEVDHFYTTIGDQDLNLKRNDVLNDLDDIEDEAIRLLNLQYGGVATLDLFPALLAVDEGTLANMENVSTVSTSGHAFEYVGAGITYNALPFFGGSAIAANEFVETNNGKVFAGGTVDQIGNFKVGNFFNVNALTGAITLNAEEINLNGIASIGPFKRFGIPVGVELKEVSNSSDLTASTGSADSNTVPTQIAVRDYVENRYLNKLTGGTVEGDTIFAEDVEVNGSEISTTSTTFDLFNDNANTLNFAGGTTQLTIGADDIGTSTFRHNVVVDLDLTVDGGDIKTNVTDTFNLLNENASTINAFGDATIINMGAISTDSILTFNSEIVIFNSVGTLQIPVGTTEQRGADSTAAIGQIRFNTTDSTFEGYDGANWGTLGGVKDVDQDTFIRPETVPGADEDVLEFFTDGVERLTLSNTTLTLDDTVNAIIQSVTGSDSYDTGALTVLGGVGISENLHVQGWIGGDTSNELQLTRYATDKVIIPANTIESTDPWTFVVDAADSATDSLIRPLTLAHHNQAGTAVAGSGVGMNFEIETTNNNYVTGARIDVISLDVTTGQEDFDMVITTHIEGADVEKVRISEDTTTITTDLRVNGALITDGILDAAGFTGSLFADDSTEIIDAVNNKLTVVDGAIETLTLTNDLEVQYGGTGRGSFIRHGILYGNDTGEILVTDAAGSSDTSNSFQILTITDSGDDTPVWTDTIDGGEF